MHSKRSPLFTPIEILEPRVAPAGVIDIVTKGGSAFIKVFGNTDSTQDLTIAGSLDGTIFLFGNDNETFRLNGSAGNGPVALSEIVGNLSIDLGKSNDDLEVTGLFLGGKLTIKMGDGANETTITSSTVGSFTYTGGAGQDTLVSNGPNFDSAGKVTLQPGGGVNSVAFQSAALHIGGDLVYTGGAGRDTLGSAADLTVIGGNVLFKGGTGANLLTFTSGTIVVGKNVSYQVGANLTNDEGGASFQADDLLRIGGSFKYVNPQGPQSIVLTSNAVTEISGAVSVKATPSLLTSVVISGQEFLSSGKITIAAKGPLEAIIGGGVFAINGGVAATGVHKFTLSGEGLLSGALTVSYGIGGANILGGFSEGDLRIAGPTKLTAISSSNQNALTTITRVQFLSSFSAKLGAGADTVVADNIKAFGAFSLASGGVGDAIQIETNGIEGHGTFYGRVTLKLGGGIDILTVGAGNGDNQIFAYRAFKVLGGSGEVISLLNGNVFVVDPVIA